MRTKMLTQPAKLKRNFLITLTLCPVFREQLTVRLARPEANAGAESLADENPTDDKD